MFKSLSSFKHDQINITIIPQHISALITTKAYYHAYYSKVDSKRSYVLHLKATEITENMQRLKFMQT